MKLEAGKTYKITHSRKGTFTMRVESQSGDVTNGVMVEGRTVTIQPQNSDREGDKVSVRTSFIVKAVEL